MLQAKTQLAGAQARQIQFEGVLSAAKHEFEYVFEMLEIGEIISIMGIDRWKVEEELPPGIGIVDFLLETGAAKSRKQAKQLIKQGGCYINNIRVDIDKRVTEDDLASESMMVLRIGKKDYRLVRFE